MASSPVCVIPREGKEELGMLDLPCLAFELILLTLSALGIHFTLVSEFKYLITKVPQKPGLV